MEENLFRQEATRAVGHRFYGAPCMMMPFPYTKCTYAIGVLLPLFVFFALFASFSEHYTVRGYLDASQGIARVYASETGILSQYHVKYGQHVKKGEVLFRLKTHDKHLNHAERRHILQQLKQRKNNLQHTLKTKKNHLQALLPLLNKKYIATSTYQAVADEILALEQALTQTQLELASQKHAENEIIRAPISGKITNITTKIGQQIHPSKPILDIIPEPSTLVVQLTIPVSKIGYIHPNDLITLHYDAYPDEHTPFATGQIQDISQTITIDPQTSPTDLTHEPYYNAMAILHQQTIHINGIEQSLQLGMTCSAVIHGPRKKIWRFIFDPLFRLSKESLS